MSARSCLRHTFVSVSLLAATACSTAPPSIFQPFTLDRGNSVATDAGQRVIVNMKTHASSRPGRVNPERIICAEPSPDVASAVASSFGFGLNILGKANTALSNSQGTALAQLAERTITVQLLRDQMYQACQAYANGAISGTEYSLLMSRNNDAMVTLMLGESAARLVGRNLATASVGGSGSATATMPDIVKALTEAADAQDEAEDANKEAVDAAKTKAATDAAVQGTNADTSDAGTDNAENNAAQAANNQEDTEQKADEKNKKAKETIEKAVSVVTNASTTASTTAGGFTAGPPTLNEHAVGVAEQLVELQENYFGQGTSAHFIAACTVELGNNRNFFNIDWNRAEDPKLKLTNDRQGFDQQVVSVANAAVAYNAAETNAKGIEIASELMGLANQVREAEEIKENAEDEKLYISTYKNGDLSDNVLNGAGKAYDVAQRIEQNRGFLGIFGRRKSITEDRLRTLVALENAKKASVLSDICYQLLDSELELDRQDLHKKDLFNFMIDLERERSKRFKSARPGSPPPSKPKPDLKDIPRLVAEYVLCDEEADGSNANSDAEQAKVEACRIRVLAQITDEGSGANISSHTNTNGVAYEESLAGPYIVLIASYGSKQKADENWLKIESALGQQLLAGKKKSLKKIKSNGQDQLSLRLGSFTDEASATSFCQQAKPKLDPIGGQCIPKKL